MFNLQLQTRMALSVSTPEHGTLAMKIAAAAHEVGHFVMAVACGEAVNSLSIVPDGERGGEMRFHEDLRMPLSPDEVAPRPGQEVDPDLEEVALDIIKIWIGGCAGIQYFANRLKRCVGGVVVIGTPDWSLGGKKDREVADAYMNAIGVKGDAANDLIQKLWAEVELTFLQNGEAFDRLVDELVSRKKMSEDELAGLVADLGGLSRVDLVGDFSALDCKVTPGFYLKRPVFE